MPRLPALSLHGLWLSRAAARWEIC
jgi:hypothetical protein